MLFDWKRFIKKEHFLNPSYNNLMNEKLDLTKIKEDLNRYLKENLTQEIRITSLPRMSRVISRSLSLDRSVDSLSDRNLDDLLKHVDDTFQQALFYYIDSKKLNEVEVYNSSHIDRRLFSKIRSDVNFKPSRKTAICLCFGLKLNLDETTDLLGKAGFHLSHSSKADLIVEYFIQKKIYDLTLLNQILDEYGESPLYL